MDNTTEHKKAMQNLKTLSPWTQDKESLIALGYYYQNTHNLDLLAAQGQPPILTAFDNINTESTEDPSDERSTLNRGYLPRPSEQLK